MLQRSTAAATDDTCVVPGAAEVLESEFISSRDESVLLTGPDFHQDVAAGSQRAQFGQQALLLVVGKQAGDERVASQPHDLPARQAMGALHGEQVVGDDRDCPRGLARAMRPGK